MGLPMVWEQLCFKTALQGANECSSYLYEKVKNGLLTGTSHSLLQGIFPTQGKPNHTPCDEHTHM